jgi:excisionase family DNA binding protein
MNNTNNTTLETKFLTVNQTADRWQCHAHSVRNMIDRGELKAVKIGKRSIRIPLQSILDNEKTR